MKKLLSKKRFQELAADYGPQILHIIQNWFLSENVPQHFLASGFLGCPHIRTQIEENGEVRDIPVLRLPLLWSWLHACLSVQFEGNCLTLGRCSTVKSFVQNCTTDALQYNKANVGLCKNSHFDQLYLPWNEQVYKTLTYYGIVRTIAMFDGTFWILETKFFNATAFSDAPDASFMLGEKQLDDRRGLNEVLQR